MQIHVKDEVSMNIYMDRRSYERKVPKMVATWKLEVRLTKKSNQHILGACMHIYAKDEVCTTTYSELSIDSKPKKSTKMPVIYKP